MTEPSIAPSLSLVLLSVDTSVVERGLEKFQGNRIIEIGLNVCRTEGALASSAPQPEAAPPKP